MQQNRHPHNYPMCHSTPVADLDPINLRAYAGDSYWVNDRVMLRPGVADAAFAAANPHGLAVGTVLANAGGALQVELPDGTRTSLAEAVVGSCGALFIAVVYAGGRWVRQLRNLISTFCCFRQRKKMSSPGQLTGDHISN